ncbi:MAG: HEAT repeat domain-containing protein [Opitutales bacterium]|nr:HEAT repeat domain-containing protein [Opitutales bacterium]
MKKTLFTLCFLAAAFSFADNPNSKQASSDEICNAMQDMRSYDWGQPSGKLESYLYPLYRTSTADKKEAVAIEKKAVEELKSGQGTTRYKELLGETLAICGVSSTANELAEIVAKSYSKEENRRWVERVMIALGRASDKNAKDALLKLAGMKGYISIDAVSALGSRGEADKEIAKMLAAAGKDKHKYYACVAALARISSPASIKALLTAMSKASDPAMKLAAGEALISSASSSKKAAKQLEDCANKILSDSKASLPLQLNAYSALARLGKAPAPKSKDFLIAAIDVFGSNKKLAAPSFLDFAKLEEPEQALLVQAYARRGDGFDKIIKLTPKSAPLAEAIAFAASRMGSEKDFERLASFAPLFSGDREKAVLAQYISEIRAGGKLLKLSDLAKNSKSEDEKKVLLMATENLDSSSVADTLLGVVKNGSSDEKIAALKTLNTAQSKNAYVFVKVAELFPSLKGKEIQAAQRLLVNLSRVSCNEQMFKAAMAQYNQASDMKTKGFFVRFAAPCGTAEAAEFLAKVYADGLKNEALREFAGFKNENAFEALKKIEKLDSSNKEKIREVGIDIVHQNGLVKSPYVKYISSTAMNAREKNLATTLEMPKLSHLDVISLPNGIKGRATHGAGILKRAFDDDMNSRWSSDGPREPGIAILLEMPDSQAVKGIELMLGSSRNDRVLDPKVFVGDELNNMRKLEFNYEKAASSDILKFKKPETFKYVCVVNTKASGGNWSIHEVKIQK